MQTGREAAALADEKHPLSLSAPTTAFAHSMLSTKHRHKSERDLPRLGGRGASPAADAGATSSSSSRARSWRYYHRHTHVEGTQHTGAHTRPPAPEAPTHPRARCTRPRRPEATTGMYIVRLAHEGTAASIRASRRLQRGATVRREATPCWIFRSIKCARAAKVKGAWFFEVPRMGTFGARGSCGRGGMIWFGFYT